MIKIHSRAGEMDFKVKGRAWNTKKYYQPPRLANKKNFPIFEIFGVFSVVCSCVWCVQCSL